MRSSLCDFRRVSDFTSMEHGVFGLTLWNFEKGFQTGVWEHPSTNALEFYIQKSAKLKVSLGPSSKTGMSCQHAFNSKL